MKVRKLPPGLVSRIAAGEVVERPASILKELIENSLDAGADRIYIEIRKAGRVLIKVKDNGSGMSREEAILSLERHATSKIYSDSDFYSVSTFGFRGEALPSMATVSRLRMLTKSNESSAGTEVRVESGEVLETKPVACTTGTTIEVRELFFNTPARRKFLKSDAHENAAMKEVISRFLLAFPEVHFEVVTDGKKKVFPPESLEVRIRELFDEENIIEVNYRGNIEITGFIQKPGSSRAGRLQYFFVNRRFIKNRLLTAALYEAYRAMLPKHRHPLALLFINISPEEIDVNVHPTKIEVRFRQEKEVLKELVEAIRKALYPPRADSKIITPVTRTIEDFSSIGKINTGKPEVNEDKAKYSPEKNLEDNILRGIKPLAQLFNTYILAEHSLGLVMIDQHAAHERVLYEKFLKKYSAGKIEKQRLLKPEVILLAPEESAAMLENIEFLENMGFEIEDFGGESIIIRTVPLFIGKMENFKEFIAEIADAGRISDINRRRDEMIYRVACTGAVKAGDFMLEEEMKALIEKLRRADNPRTCPHGRPTYIILEKRDIERKFRR